MGATISIAFVEYHVIKNDMKIIRRIYNAGGEFRYKGNVWSGFVCNGNLRIVTLFDTISISKFSIQVYCIISIISITIYNTAVSYSYYTYVPY